MEEMEVSLKFTLPKDKASFETAYMAWEYKTALNTFHNWLISAEREHGPDGLNSPSLTEIRLKFEHFTSTLK